MNTPETQNPLDFVDANVDSPVTNQTMVIYTLNRLPEKAFDINHSDHMQLYRSSR